MSLWKKSVFAAGFAAALGAGLLLSPAATAQPADADNAISSHYQDKGGASSPLGEKVGAVYAFGPNGAAQDYRGGKIVYSPDTGAKVMYGAILDKYLALGGANNLGYPKNDESDAPVAGTARFSEFSAPDGATIEWSPQHGAWLVRGPIRTAWSHLHATDGVLGAPMTDTTVADGVYSQTFSGQNGTPVEMRWNRESGFATVPPDIAGQLSGLDVSAPGPAPGAAADAGTAAAATNNDHRWWGRDSNAKWWALPIGLVIAALAGGVAAMVSRSGSDSSRGSRSTGMPATAGGPGAGHLGGAHRWRPGTNH